MRRKNNILFSLSLSEKYMKNCKSDTNGQRQGVNFINVLRTNFLYERRFSSYVLALSKNLYEKFVRKTLMKLTEVFR